MPATGTRLKTLKKQQWGYYFVIPAAVLFAFFVIRPFVVAVINGFYDYGLSGRKFVGLANYAKILNDPIAIKTITNTLVYVAVIVPVILAVSLLVSLAIYKRGALAKGYVRAVFYLPAVVPSVCLAVVWKWLYNPNFGLLNTIIKSLGGPEVNFLGDPNIAIYSVIFIVITWTIGLPIILYTAALGGIPETLLEAAEIDGAGEWKKFWRVTWPLLRPTTLYIMVTATIGTMQVVEAVLLTTAGGPYYASNTMLLMIYTEAFKLNHFGYASAIGNVMFVIIFIISLIQFKFLSADVEY